MNKLTRFELKKIYKSKTAIIAIVILIAATIFIIAAAISSAYSYDQNGIELGGFAAISREKKLNHELAGEVTLELISNTIALKQKIMSDKANLTEKGEMSNQAFSKYWYKFMDINMLIGTAYAPKDENNDFYAIDKLTPEDGKQFYYNRIKKVNEFLNMDYSYGNYTTAEKEYFLNMNKKVDTPFYYDYSLGWKNLLSNLSGLCLVLAFVMCICIAPVFANEYQTRTDSVIFSSKYGRSKVFTSKIKSSFIFSTVLYLGSILIFTLIMLGIYGFSGWNCNIQINDFIAPYNVNYLQAYLIIMGLGYLGYISIMAITLFLSAKMKTNFAVIIISAVILFLPTLIPHSRTFRLINYIVALLPSKIMDGFFMLRSYKVYNIFGNLVLQPWVMIWTSILLTAAMLYFAYTSYKKHQVRN